MKHQTYCKFCNLRTVRA